MCAAVVMGTAHLQRGHQLPAHGGTLGQAEEAAAPLLVKLHLKLPLLLKLSLSPSLNLSQVEEDIVVLDVILNVIK